MRRIIVTCLLVWLFSSCKQGNMNEAGPQRSATDSIINGTAGIAKPEYREGARLIGKSDCLLCHAVEKKVIGPSFTDIARRYKADQGLSQYLANFIIHGTKGLWGPAEMTPHPNLPLKDATLMTSYILSLDTTLHRK
jgi:cytochrome c